MLLPLPKISRVDWLASLLLYALAFLFTGIGLLQLGLVRNTPLDLAAVAPLLTLMACAAAAVLVPRWLRPHRATDPLLLSLVFFLSGFGLVLIARLAPAFIARQQMWLVAATAALLLVSLLPQNLNWLYRYKYTWLGGGLLLLGSTLLLGVNPSGFGARLWLQVGGIYFQPSELLKLLLLVFLAAYMADRRHHLINARAYLGPIPLPHPAYIGPMLLMWGFSLVLLVWQRDLGAALLFFATFLALLYAATGQTRYLWTGLLLLAAAGVIGYLLFDVVRIRVDGFLDPWLDPSGRSFQIVQSLLAFASGSIFGEGLGQGLPTAIPVVHTDFVYAAIGEEYGLLGALGVLLLFALLVSRAFVIAIRAQTEFEQLLALGIGTMLALQTIVITAGTLKLLPLTGVTLPFVSYGGSSLLVSFIMVGLLHFIAGRQAAGAMLPPTEPTAPPIFHLPLARGLFSMMLVVAGGLVLWQVLLSPLLVGRSDNPRRVVAEQRIERGRILTRSGIPIAESVMGADGLAERRYPYPSLSSVTGYYSLRYGLGGTEAAFDPVLRGAVGVSAEDGFWNDLLHHPTQGQDVTLTIDLPAQAAADVALGTQEGAVVVLDLQTGAVLVMSSHPTYDPNTLDADWDSLRLDRRAPLLNRATQGLFPLGDMARLVTLIGLHEAGALIPDDAMTAPLADLAAPLGPTGYRATARQLGLSDLLAGLPSQPARLPEFPPQGKQTPRDLAATPLHLARAVAALENGGRLPNPVLTLHTQATHTPAIAPKTAQWVRAQLPQIDAQIVGLTGQATPEETGAGWLSWFVGLAPAQAWSVERPTPAALIDGALIFDPTQIPTPVPTPAVEFPPSDARYVIVAVVTTDSPPQSEAFRIGKAVIGSLLE